MMDAAFMSS